MCAHHELLEIFHAAQLRVCCRVVLNSPRRAHIIRTRGQRIVLALAVDLTNRVNRREVDGVKAHRSYALKGFFRGGKSAMHWLAVVIAATGGTWEKLIPRVKQRLWTLHEYLLGGPLGEHFAEGVMAQDLRNIIRKRQCDALGHARGAVIQSHTGAQQ